MERTCRVIKNGIVGDYNLRAGSVMQIDERYIPTLVAAGMIAPLAFNRTANVAPSSAERVRNQSPPGVPGIPPGARVLVKLPEVS